MEDIPFISGVVEGFYGTPWQISQREDLFEKLKKWQMNTYVYAPKDDPKHRKHWRKRYMTIEKRILKRLITSARANDVEFIYAISPGNDIVFSSPTDMKYLKDKLTQVYKLGCRAFAILFDDIDPKLCLVDKTEFLSSADAQATVTNSIYNEFHDLKLLLFCPTEYCARRAIPDIEKSEYLLTVGRKLNPAIHILWTGPKVVSREITSQQLIELSNVIKRKPIIWENLHANDYDQRRVFFGPLVGRPADIRAHINGFLTNPNCEYECNFMAICTLGHWVKATNSNDDSGKTDDPYDAKVGFDQAMDEWFSEMMTSRSLFRKTSRSGEIEGAWGINSLIEKEILEELVNEHDPEIITSSESESEMTNELSLSDSSDDADTRKRTKKKRSSKKKCLSKNDVILLCDLFYLPYENGVEGDKLIRELKWLKRNALEFGVQLSQDEIDAWYSKSDEFCAKCERVNELYEKFVEIPNKRIVKEIHPYIYDLNEVVTKTSKFVKYMGSKERENGETFLPKDPEPYSYKGGVLATLERVLPNMDDDPADTDSNIGALIIRPFISSDTNRLKEFCFNLSDKEQADQHSDIKFDILLSPYLHSSTDLIYVVLVKDIIKGFVAGTKNVKTFAKYCKNEWIHEMLKKYSQASSKAGDTVEIHIKETLEKRVDQINNINEKDMILLTWELDHGLNASVLKSMVDLISTMLGNKSTICTAIKERDLNRYKRVFRDIGLKLLKITNEQENDTKYYYK